MTAIEDIRTRLDLALDALYRAGPAQLSPWLEVCQCNCCMDEPTRKTMIATPVRQLSVELIKEYSNSAHGVPADLDDLRAVLPRYLELILHDEMVDYNGVGTELARFGDARAENRGFPSKADDEVLDTCARLLILLVGLRTAANEDLLYSPVQLMEIFLVGGWSVATITNALDGLFAESEAGRAALTGFLNELGHRLRHSSLELWGLTHRRKDAWPALARWLNDLLLSEPVAEIATDPELAEETRVWIIPLLGLAGRLDADAFTR
jgi:hypothetical protein